MLIWEESFVYVFSRNADIHLDASETDKRDKEDDPVDAECPTREDSCGGSRDDLLGGAKSSCFTPST